MCLGGCARHLGYMGDGLDEWFMSEILPLEPMLQRFLRRHWHDEADTADLLQETYMRVYEAARRQRPSMPKPFAFMTARNLVIDRIRKKNVVSIERMADIEWLNLTDDEVSPEQHTQARQELRRLQSALDMLPQRCRQVVMLRKVEGMSQREVAQHMNATEEAVEHLVAKGMRLLAQHLHGPRRPIVASAKRYIALRKSKRQ